MDLLRRDAAADYLRSQYGHWAKSTLAKLATLGGGPEIIYSGRIPLYTREALDRWAQANLLPPVTSTAGRKAVLAERKAAASQEAPP